MRKEEGPGDKIRSPLLRRGSRYQNENPFRSMILLYVESSLHLHGAQTTVATEVQDDEV
jgi:hypothetical protein